MITKIFYQGIVVSKITSLYKTNKQVLSIKVKYHLGKDTLTFF